MKRFISVATVLLCFTVTANADDRKPTDKPFDDATFIAQAASGGIHEVELGKLALTKSMREDVKRFAQKMVDDHSKANDALKAAATSAGIKAPDKMNDKHQKEFDKFKELKAEEFDRAYIKQMVKDHEADVDEFTKASKQAKNAAIRDFAANTLPVVQSHLEMIRKINETK